MSLEAWLTIAATILGPVLAVQAQKAVESIREINDRKTAVFDKLMATRASRVSPEHVQALNMIDIAFYGRTRLGIRGRSKTEHAVLDAWREYHDHLGIKADGAGIPLWNVTSQELFINLLFAMSRDLHYTFDRVQLKRGAYSPMAHGELEIEQASLRRAAIRAFSGEVPLRMEIAAAPGLAAIPVRENHSELSGATNGHGQPERGNAD